MISSSIRRTAINYRPRTASLTHSRSSIARTRRSIAQKIHKCNAWTDQILFAVSTLYILPIYYKIIIHPKKKSTIDLVRSPKIITPLALIYLFLLIKSWRPDTLQLMMPGDIKEGFKGFSPQYFPQLSAIRILFSRATTAASLWVHILSVNLFFARRVFLQGTHKRIPTRHSCVLAMLAGPLGLLSDWITDLVFFK